MASITAANAIITLSIPPIFTVPQQLQGFAADDVFDVPEIKSVETLMGVDGKLSGGFVYVPIPQTIMLQADSLSNDLFDTWWTQMQAAKDTYIALGQARLTSIGTKFTMVGGFLTGYKPTPGVKRILQPRRFEITWESIVPSPT